MVSEVENDLMDKIRDSDYYKSFFQNLKSEYEHVEEGSHYKYKPNRFESEYLVVITVNGVSEKSMNIMFKINENEEIIDAEASIDMLSGVGKPKEVDEYIGEYNSIKDKVRSIRDEN